MLLNDLILLFDCSNLIRIVCERKSIIDYYDELFCGRVTDYWFVFNNTLNSRKVKAILHYSTMIQIELYEED